MSESVGSLAAALSKVQAALPRVTKGETATVPTKAGGSYSYAYADLTEISEAILPLLAENGLAFTASPHLRDDGHFVLRYSLLHSSGRGQAKAVGERIAKVLAEQQNEQAHADQAGEEAA